jgi:hypothetical protein
MAVYPKPSVVLRMKSPTIKKQSSMSFSMFSKAAGHHPGPFAPIHQRLDHMRVHFEWGSVAALYDALYVVEELGLKAPGWVLKGALRIVGDRLKKGKSIGHGSSGNEQINYRRQVMHYQRWRAYQVVLAEGIPKIDAFAEVSERLKGTYAEGGEDTIEKSVKQVTKMLKNPKWHAPYLPMLQSSKLAGAPALKMEGIYFGKN